MEKFSQFRDRGSGISPFIPITTPSSTTMAMFHAGLFLFRLPFFLSYVFCYFLFLHHLPLPPAARKLLLWALMAIPGLWWVDLQLDGVKRGSLARQPPSRVPHPGSVIAASLTSPVDALYLAAVFDPIFVESFPGTRKVRRIGLLRAIMLALAPPVVSAPSLPPASPSSEDDQSRSKEGEEGPSAPPPSLSSSSSSTAPMAAAAAAANAEDNNNNQTLTDIRALLAAHPTRVIAVFPEASATNGRGVLPFTPSLLGAPHTAPIFPISVRYTPPDITTPVPGAWASFLWNLLSRSTHFIRVRIAEGVIRRDRERNGGMATREEEEELEMYEQQQEEEMVEETEEGEEPMTVRERFFLDEIAETLARLARNKRVGLTLRDKAAFVEAWRRKGRRD